MRGQESRIVSNDRGLKTVSGVEAAEAEESVAPVKEPNSASNLGQSALLERQRLHRCIDHATHRPHQKHLPTYSHATCFNYY